MPYYTGSASNMSQVRDAIVSACTANGWSWSNEVIGKDGVFVRLWLDAGWLCARGRTSAGSGDAPAYVKIGPVNPVYTPLPPLVYPVTTHIFVHSSEVYCIIKYGVDSHQFIAFGQSGVSGLPGTGAWFGATCPQGNIRYGLFLTPHGAHCRVDGVGAALFFSYTTQEVMAATTFMHHGLDAGGWSASAFDGRAVAPLYSLQPSAWTGESALLPIRGYCTRSENKISLVAELAHSRHISVANLEPGQIIAMGNDRWMCFPLYRKSFAPIQQSGFYPPDVSGTLGIAIRYDGP